MFKHETEVRVRYSETDKMSFVYYGHYAQYFEVGRVEALRALGFPYKSLEDRGIMLPVTDFSIRFLKPAVYDDVLLVNTTISEMPRVKIRFDYEIFRKDDLALLTMGNTTLVFVDMKSGRPARCPSDMSKVLEPFFLPA